MISMKMYIKALLSEPHEFEVVELCNENNESIKVTWGSKNVGITKSRKGYYLEGYYDDISFENKGNDILNILKEYPNLFLSYEADSMMNIDIIKFAFKPNDDDNKDDWIICNVNLNNIHYKKGDNKDTTVWDDNS